MDLNCIPYKAAIGTRSDLWERPSIHFALQNTQDARDNFKAGCVRRSLPSLKARTNVGWVGRGPGISPANGDSKGVFLRKPALVLGGRPNKDFEDKNEHHWT